MTVPRRAAGASSFGTLGVWILISTLLLTSPTGASAQTPRPSPTRTSTGPECFGKSATIVGTNDDDVLYGSGAGDVIHGLGGSDKIRAANDNDVICGGTGDDLLEGWDAADLIDGEAGNDLILGYGGDDTLLGGDGNDFVNGDDFHESGSGGRISVGDDSIHGGNGDDALVGGAGTDSLDGETGNDSLAGGTDDDSLVGGDGIDRLFFATGEDMDPVEVDLSASQVSAPGGDDTLSTIENVSGTRGDDTIVGDDGANNIISEQGDDTVDGRGGDDTIVAGSPSSCRGSDVNADDGGRDTVNGGAGNDFIHGGAYGCRSGRDTDDILDGDSGNDRIFGSEGDDTLMGSEGDDLLSGQLGADTLDGGDGIDRCIEGDDAAACETIDMAMDCEDGHDNDGDYAVDFPADPGCTSPTDDYEGFPTPPHYHLPGTRHILHFDEQGSVFNGEVDNTESRCDPGRSIVLHRTDTMEEVARTNADHDGLWTLEVEVVRGATYAATAELGEFTTDGGERVECPELRSNEIEAPLLPPPTVEGPLRLVEYACKSWNRRGFEGRPVKHCARVYEVGEQDVENDRRDYGVLWYQLRVPRTSTRGCTLKVKARPYSAGMELLGFSPGGRWGARKARDVTVSISAPNSSTSASVRQGWRLYPVKTIAKPSETSAGLRWTGTRRGSLSFVMGFQASWPRDASPGAANVLTNPAIDIQKRRTC